MKQATKDRLRVAAAYADSVTDKALIWLVALPHSWAVLLGLAAGCFALGVWW